MASFQNAAVYWKNKNKNNKNFDNINQPKNQKQMQQKQKRDYLNQKNNLQHVKIKNLINKN